MEIDTPELKAYLFELYTMTGGDVQAQVSMYEVGIRLGLEKSEAGTQAETLFMEGYAELKTLSGGIGITRKGLKALDVALEPEESKESLHLGKGPELEAEGRKDLETVLTEIKQGMAQANASYGQWEQMVIDIKTIEVQMLSPHPKTAVIREVLRSMGQCLPGKEDLKGKLDALIAS